VTSPYILETSSSPPYWWLFTLLHIWHL